jgi:8-amino-7-oxononanoate synthase
MPMHTLLPDLELRRRAERYRTRRVVVGPQQPEREIEGRQLLSFSSNDYLGLAADPRVCAAAHRALDRYGVGSGAAHLLGGHSHAHHALEEELAAFTGRARALMFATGYMANIGVLTALLGRADLVLQDRLNHASLIDAALQSRARLRRYRHCDEGHAEELLAAAGASGRRLVATDGVFSMDGDLAPLPEIAAAAGARGAWLMVDDAHGLGVLGKEGGGSVQHYGLNSEQVPILMGTLGKALGTFGAFVAGSEELIETLIQQARSYIYTTAPPPAVAEATRVSVRLARQEGWRRDRLRDLVQRFRRAATELGLPLTDSLTPIQPLIAGATEQAVRWSRQLEHAGILVPAVRPPTVPEGGARLRITFSALHTDLQLARLLDALAALPQGTRR